MHSIPQLSTLLLRRSCRSYLPRARRTRHFRDSRHWAVPGRGRSPESRAARVAFASGARPAPTRSERRRPSLCSRGACTGAGVGRAPRPSGKSLVAAGLVEGGEDGLALLREAVAVLEPSQARLEHARALVELGSAMRRANRRSEAREPLRRGLELATVCGASPLAERAETELLASGARPRRTALERRGLTHAERAARRADGGRRRYKPRDRPGTLRHSEDGRDAPVERVSKARHRVPLAALEGANGRALARRLIPERLFAHQPASSRGVSRRHVAKSASRNAPCR